MSGEGRPVTRIPSIFDSDDDSEEDSCPPMTYRGITTSTTTTTSTAKPISESQPEPAAAPPDRPQSLSSNSDSDGESLSPKPEEPKEGKATVSSPHAPSSSESSEDSEDGSGEKDLVFSSREDKVDDDATLMANDEDDINISHSSPENQDGSEDEEDDSSNSDDDDDESDDDQDRSGSSVEYEGAVLSEDGGSHVVYSPATPLSIKITTVKKGEFAIRQETTSSKSPFRTESKDEERESRSDEKEKLEVEEEKKSLDLDEKDDEKMETIETSKEDEITVDEKDKMEDVCEKEDTKSDESSTHSTPDLEKMEERNETEEKPCKTLSAEEKKKDEEEEEEEAAVKIDEESVHSEPEETKDEKPLEDLEAEDTESTKGDTTDSSKSTNTKSSEKSEVEPMEVAVKEDEDEDTGKQETAETEPHKESDESDTGALEMETTEPQEPETKEEVEEVKKNEDKEEEEPMEVEEEEEEKDVEKEAKDEIDIDKQEVEKETKMEEEEEEKEGTKKPHLDKETAPEKEEEEEEEEKEKEKEKEKEVKETDIKKDDDEKESKEDKQTTASSNTEKEKEDEVKMEEGEKDTDLKERIDEDDNVVEVKETKSDAVIKESSLPPQPPPAPSIATILDSETDSEASMDAMKTRDIITAAAAKRTKVPLRVEDVYLDSEEDSENHAKLQGEDVAGGGDGGGDGGERGRQSAMTSETDSVDPEDQRDCLSQHSSSRASSTDLFIKVSSCSPRAESPSDIQPSVRYSSRTRKGHVPTPTELANYLEAFRQGWRREIVFRATQNPTKAGGARADIYYYSPSDKKFRSRVEIEDYLLRNGIKDLTLKNFTWIKEPLGVSEEHEQIRHASNKNIFGIIAPPRRKPGQCTPGSSPSSTPKSSASSQVLSTPKAFPVVTITSFTKTPPPRSPHTTRAPSVPVSVPSVSASPVVTNTSVTTSVPAPVVTSVSATSATSAKPSYVYDVSVPKKRGRGRPRKNPEEAQQKRARMRITPVPIMMKKSAGRGGVAPPPLRPAPPPPPPPAILPALPVTSVMNVVQRPVLSTPTARPKQTRKTKDPIVTTGHLATLPPCPPKILTPMLTGGARQRTFHCTGNCPLGGGSVPCLQCLKCLCLFHPECTCMPPPTVSIIQAGAAKFLCPNCYWENKENMASSKWIPSEPFEPLAHDPIYSSSSSSSDSEDEDGHSGKKVWVEDYTKVCLRPDSPPTPPSSLSPSHSLGPWRTDGSDSRQDMASDTPLSAGPGEVMRGVPAISGFPPSAATVGSQLVQIQQQGAGPACFLLVQGASAAPGGELMSMPGGGGGGGGSGGAAVGIPKGMPSIILPRLPVPQQQQQQQLQIASPFLIQQQQFQQSQIPVNMPPQEAPQQKPERLVGKHYKQYYKAMSQWDNTFLGELSQRYLLLRHVFKYLSVKDLLVASQVCLLWRDLAFSSTLWETVRLRNVCVKDWNEFAHFLEQRNTKSIDLRKMRLRKSVASHKDHSGKSFQATPKPSKDRRSSAQTEERNEKKTGSEEGRRESKFSSESSQTQDRKADSHSRSTVDEKDRNGHRKERKDEAEAENDKRRGMKRKRSMEEAQESQDKDDQVMVCTEEETESRGTSRGDNAKETPTTKQESEEAEWLEIFTALSNVRCLRGVTLPSCPGQVLQLLLASCKHITSINAMDLRSTHGCVRFDPAYLMEAPNLVELRVGSPSGFSLTTNFNFIKLQKLRVLVMRGLSGDTWPYLGTNLTTLQVGPVKTFSLSTWTNLGNMTNLQALWLEEGGSILDSSIYEGLSRLTNLRRLCLFNFVVGPKLGQALKKLPRLERLFILPVGTEEASVKSQNGNMLVVLDVLRSVEELVWGVHASDVSINGGVDCIQMSSSKTKVFSGMMENPESSLWPLPELEKVLKRCLHQSNVRIIKLDPTAASHLALATL